MLKSSLKSIDWKKKLIKEAKRFYKDNKTHIIDIVLYGSFARGKDRPRDIDIMVILKNVDKKEYFDLPYKFRKSVERKEMKVDVKGVFLEELFSPELLARQGLLIEGYSLIKGDYIGKRMGFDRFSLFVYSLKNLSLTGKTKFQYALKGRGDNPGFLKETNGIQIGKGSVLVPTENSESFKGFLESWEIKYEEWRGLFVKA